MKRKVWITTLVVLSAAFLANAAPPAHAKSCSLAGVAGRYGYTLSGTIVTPPVGPVVGVGHVTLEVSGNLSGAQTASFAGNIFNETLSGTYTVNPDCTGTATINVFRSGVLVRTSVLNLVYDDHQREIRAIFTTAGTAITVNVRKMFRDKEEKEEED